LERTLDFQPMSPDEMHRTMQFLLGQQAKFSVDFDRLSEKVERLADTTDRLAEKTDRLAEKTDRLAATADRIADAVIDLTGIVGRLATSQDDLRDIVQRHLREDHGYPSPESR
jgi:ABC-type transporter Mla subunit MlaD